MTNDDVIDCVCDGHYINTPASKKQHMVTKKHKRYVERKEMIHEIVSGNINKQ